MHQRAGKEFSPLDINLVSQPLKKLIPPDAYLVYKPTDILIDANGLQQPNYAEIEQLKQYRFVVINCSTEHWGNNFARWFNTLIKPTGLRYIIISSDPADHLIEPNIIFYPYYYYGSIEVNQQTLSNNVKLERKYLLSSLNRVPRPHRILTYLTFSKKSYFNDCLFSLHAPLEEYNDPNALKLDTNTLEEWQHLKNTLPKQRRVDLSSRDDAYTDSYINLITESNVAKGVYITEKTWKPISVGQMFLLMGSPNSIEFLKDMGVDVYEDYIDHKYYDSELVAETRVQKIFNLADSLVNTDLHKIYQETQARREKNIKNYYNGSFNNKYAGALEQCINTLN